MPDIIDILNKITAAKGPEFTEGLVVGINLTTPRTPDPEPQQSGDTTAA